MNHPKLITLSIDVTQLDKSRFKEIIRKGNGPRAGMKAVFADLVLVGRGAALLQAELLHDEHGGGGRLEDEAEAAVGEDLPAVDRGLQRARVGDHQLVPGRGRSSPKPIAPSRLPSTLAPSRAMTTSTAQ